MSHAFELSPADINTIHHHLEEMTRIISSTVPGSDAMALLADITDTLPQPTPQRYSDIELSTDAIAATHAIWASEDTLPYPPYDFIFVIDYDTDTNTIHGLGYAPWARSDDSQPQLLSFKPEELILTHRKWITPATRTDPYFIFHYLIAPSISEDPEFISEIAHLKPHMDAIADHINAHYCMDTMRKNALTKLYDLIPIHKIHTMHDEEYTYQDHFMAEALTFDKKRVFVLTPDTPEADDYVCFDPEHYTTLTVPTRDLMLSHRKAKLKNQPLS